MNEKLSPYAFPGIPADGRPEFTTTPEVIKAAVAGYFKISMEQLMSKDRKAPYPLARQICCHFMRKYVPRFTLLEIAAQLDYRDHTSVIYQITTARNLIQVDRRYRGIVENVLSAILRADREEN